jgi:hypothetical protein
MLRRSRRWQRQWRQWRQWRRSRPFAGGLLLVSAGIELLFIPLSGVFLHGAAGLAGFGGLAGSYSVQVALLEIACGVVVWVKPAHRASCGVAGAVLAIISFVTSTLGGFFAGMLLGITGGSLAFGWTPAADRAPSGEPTGGKHRAENRTTSRVLAIAMAGTLVIPPPFPAPAGAHGPHGVRGPGSAGDEQAATTPAMITAGSATLHGAAYQGLDSVRTSSGRRAFMKFTLRSLALSDFALALPRHGQTLMLRGSSAVLSGGITIDALTVSGDLFGIRLTLTPGDVTSTLLHLLRPLTPLIPMTITDLHAGQALLDAGDVRTAGVTISLQGSS